ILIALGTTVVLRRGKAERTLALEDLYRGYRQTALERGEFIRAARIPLPAAGRRVATYKGSKRFDQDISSVCLGAAMEVRDGKIANVRLAYGGMAATPKRAKAAEAALEGKKWSAAAFEAAQAELAKDFKPISDFRASADYRSRTAAALLQRFFLAHEPR